MRIGVDIMGGDFAPEATLLGAVLARKDLPEETELVLLGDRKSIDEIATRERYDLSGFTILHTPHFIEMKDHPAKAFSEKPESGIVVGLRMLKAGELDGFASAGNTGAMLVGAMQIINSIPGVIRPCLAGPIPNDRGNPTILLDIGLNPDARITTTVANLVPDPQRIFRVVTQWEKPAHVILLILATGHCDVIAAFRFGLLQRLLE